MKKIKLIDWEKELIIMPNMVSTILIDFRLLAVPSEADIMEKIVRYQYKQMHKKLTATGHQEILNLQAS